MLTRRGGGWCAVLAVAVVCVGSARGQDAPPAAESVDPVARIERALALPTSVDFQDTPLEDVIDYLGELHQIPINADRKAFGEAGVDGSMPVTASLYDLSLRSTLSHLLRPYDLDWTIRDEGLLITTEDEAATILETRIYDVSDLAQTAANAPGGTPYDSLRQAILNHVSRDSWSENGGSGSIAAVPGRGLLVVSQSRRPHEQIQRLLAELRGWRREQGLVNDAVVPGPSLETGVMTLRIQSALAAPTDLDFADTPLADAVAFLSDLNGIPILLDIKAMADDGIDPSVAVTISATGVSLRSALTRLLRDLELTWDIQDEILLITSTTAAAERKEVRIYPVLDLVARGADGVVASSLDAEGLTNVIVGALASVSWEFGTGPDEFAYIESAGVLVAAQNREVHEQIEDLLMKLRLAGKAQGPAEAAAPAPNPLETAIGEEDGKVHLKVYSLHSMLYEGGMGGFGGLGGSGGSTGGNFFQVLDGLGGVGGLASPQPIDAPVAFDAYLSNPSSTAKQFAEMLPRIIGANEWVGVDGGGTIEAVENRLIVKHKNTVHRQIVKLLGALGYGAMGQGTNYLSIESLD